MKFLLYIVCCDDDQREEKFQQLQRLQQLGDTLVSMWSTPTVRRKTKIVCTIGPSTNTKEMICVRLITEANNNQEDQIQQKGKQSFKPMPYTGLACLKARVCSYSTKSKCQLSRELVDSGG